MNYPRASTEFISFRAVLFEWKKGINYNFFYSEKQRFAEVFNTKISYFIIVLSLCFCNYK